ncbi:MAG: phosphomethylpyrimidine synthase, partial [Muribaculaceae bacterium]|nr:phosphomethylpyrimidine synthase [Muribaculaceae bacterium]
MENINVSSYPGSRKIYIPGKLFPINVAMREISQYPTVTVKDGVRKEIANEPVVVYDTSGPFT